MIITLNSEIKNDSLQVGDYVYTVQTTGVFEGGSGQPVFSYGNTPLLVGTVLVINKSSIEVDTSNSSVAPTQGDFLMFQKNKTANNASVLGYYAEFKLKNNSTDYAELFAISSDVAPSSK
tara:strand:- start:105 stop:464 length:360 start_codon:yes stop_codon:yes gene_type:complete